MIEQGCRVKFTTATHLVHCFNTPRSLRLPEVLSRMEKYAVLIIEYIGYA